MNNLINQISKLVEFISSIALCLSLVFVAIQVVSRYVFNNPLGFTQESAIYSMIATVLLGTATAFKNDSHLKVALFKDRFGVLRYSSSTLVLIFYGILMYQGWIYTERAMLQTSPQTGIRIGYFASLIPISSALCFLYVLVSMFKKEKVDV